MAPARGAILRAMSEENVEIVTAGKIVHTMVYRTPEEALEATGLSE